MTKTEIIDRHFQIMKEVDELKIYQRLIKLMEQERITTGAGYFLYDPYKWYGYKQFSKILDGAFKAKKYTRYIKRIPLWDLNCYLKDMEENFKKTIDFITEQEQLPFEQTQYQLLKSSGQLKIVE